MDRPDTRIKIEVLAQVDVDRSKTRGDPGFERSLERDPRSPERSDKRLRNRITTLAKRGGPRQLPIPPDPNPHGVDHPQRGCGDLWPDSITGNQGNSGWR